MAVTIKPMPRAYLEIPEKFRPGHPPIFDSDPSAEDVELALRLFEQLDRASRAWYAQAEASLREVGRG